MTTNPYESPEQRTVFVQRNGTQLGPFFMYEVAQGMRNGSFSDRDYFWRPGQSGWRPLGELQFPFTGASQTERRPTNRGGKTLEIIAVVALLPLLVGLYAVSRGAGEKIGEFISAQHPALKIAALMSLGLFGVVWVMREKGSRPLVQFLKELLNRPL